MGAWEYGMHALGFIVAFGLLGAWIVAIQHRAQ
jgi:hypothetical protein